MEQTKAAPPRPFMERYAALVASRAAVRAAADRVTVPGPPCPACAKPTAGPRFCTHCGFQLVAFA